MAAYTLLRGDNSLEPFVTNPSEIVTVTIQENVTSVEVMSNGAAEVRVTNGGTDPFVGGTGVSSIAWRLPAGGISIREIPMPKDSDVLKIISSGTAEISVSIPR